MRGNGACIDKRSRRSMTSWWSEIPATLVVGLQLRRRFQKKQRDRAISARGVTFSLFPLRFSALFSCSYSRYVHVVSRSLFSPPLAPSVQCAVLLLLLPLRSRGITFSFFPSSGSFGSVRCFCAPIAGHVRVCTCLR